MTYHTISKSIHIDASAQEVFDAITHWSEQSKWMLGTTVKGMKYDGKKTGGTIVARTSLGPFGFNDPMTITRWQPPFRCEVVHTGRVVKGSGAFIVEAVTHDTSTFTWSEETFFPLGFVGRIGWLCAKLPIGFALSWSLRRFKRSVESTNLNNGQNS